MQQPDALASLIIPLAILILLFWLFSRARKGNIRGSGPTLDAVNNSNRQIIFGVIVVAIGFLIYANGEQLGVTLLGGEDQIMRDMMNGAMFDKGYTNRASSIGNFLQGLYIVVIAIGSIMVLLGLAKSTK